MTDMTLYRIKEYKINSDLVQYSLERRKLFRRWQAMPGTFKNKEAATDAAKEDRRYKPIKYHKVV